MQFGISKKNKKYFELGAGTFASWSQRAPPAIRLLGGIIHFWAARYRPVLLRLYARAQLNCVGT